MTDYRPTRRALQARLLEEAVADNAALLGRRPGLPSRVRRRRGVTLLAASLLAASGIAWWTATLTPSPNSGSSAPTISAASLPLPSIARDPAPDLLDPVPMPREVFPLAVRTIALDPGHGGESAGTELASGLQEKELTLDIAIRLRAMLESSGYRVVMTRSEDRDLSLAQRSEIANESRADLLLSIHVNWIQKREVRGVETYFLGSPSEPGLEELARIENQESGYSLADRPLILDRIYDDLRRDDSRRLASSVQDALVRELRRTNPQLEDRGVKTAPFVVLAGAEMPSILAEVACLSNDSEARLLQRPEYRHRIALALASGLDAYAADVSGKAGPS